MGRMLEQSGMRPFSLPVAWAGWLMALGLMARIHADALDDCVNQEMRAHGIPGVSVAMIQDGRVSTRVYGETDASGGAITPDTLFQAASVSKVATAVGALLLVQEGRLSLDEDVNAYLKDWNVPENEFTQAEKVTVRRILSHTAGFTVHGFAGYARDALLPTLADILDGTSPANSSPIRVAGIPGSKWQYSGGGYTVLQKVMIDVTGEPFPSLMGELLLSPLQMKHSTFEQPLPAPLRASAAAGHLIGFTLPGQWHVYPEMAAAGLWTTPSDLALLVIALQQAKAGRKDGAISPTIARWMMSPVLNRDGLGLFMQGLDNEIFGHNGRNLGFDSLIRASATSGVVIMINANENTGAIDRICRMAWNQAELAPAWPAPIRKLDPTVDPKTYPDYVGRYDCGDGATVDITTAEGRLFTQRPGQNKFELFPSGPDAFFLKVIESGIVFERDKTGAVVDLVHTQNGDVVRAPKLKLDPGAKGEPIGPR